MNHRLLKFRAWDPISKRMYPEFFLFGETTCFDLISQWLMEVTPKADRLLRLNDVVIMQFTGFKDLKGDDIFEGDILELCAPEDFDLHYAEVDFENGKYTLSGCADLAGWVKWSVVKSNIFENSELLKA